MDISTKHKVESQYEAILHILSECTEDYIYIYDLNNDFFRITFFNVSRFRVGELMVPVEVHGLEIINHSQKGWEKDFKYEIRDFEDDLICFFCESFMVEG